MNENFDRKHLIIDFDGTITDLNVDWATVRKLIGVQSLREVWSFSAATRNSALDLISDFEIAGLTTKMRHSYFYWEHFKTWSVLTNNSENTVKKFFRTAELPDGFTLPHNIIGRESLNGPKEDCFIFEKGVKLILQEIRTNVTSTIYIGDQIYEEKLATSYGFSYLNVNPVSTLLERSKSLYFLK